MSKESRPDTESLADSCCFACGRNNPIGLKLRLANVDGVVRGEFVPQDLHQGWPGVTHGGILYTLLDEAGAYAVLHAGLNCITARSQVRFVGKAPLYEPIQISATVLRKTSRLVETEASLCLKDGTIIAKSATTWWVTGEPGLA